MLTPCSRHARIMWICERSVSWQPASCLAMLLDITVLEPETMASAPVVRGHMSRSISLLDFSIRLGKLYIFENFMTIQKMHDSIFTEANMAAILGVLKWQPLKIAFSNILHLDYLGS